MTYAKKNYYNQNGILLLAKGTKTTDYIIEELSKNEEHKQEALINSHLKQSKALPLITFGEKMNIRNKHVLKYPTKVLNTIIFGSKLNPWWIFANTLNNYVDWLYTHSIEVAAISLMIAAKWGYSEEELWKLGLGAFLHDAGKLLVPRDIIQKDGPLNDSERDYMKQHCELGISLLEPFNIPKECMDIVLQHHERLDGKGYPKGLKGNEISRNAKIVMIADVVDAIISNRPYKSAQTIDAAIGILKSDEEKYSEEFVTVLCTILE